MKKTIRLSVVAVALLSAQVGLANPSSWTQTLLAPKVHVANSENSNFFTTPIGVPVGALVTSISWNVGLYTNDATIQRFEVCYATRYSTTYIRCMDVTSNRVGSTDFFKGLDAKGKFKITGKLFGGTYPVFPQHRNTITVNYQY